MRTRLPARPPHLARAALGLLLPLLLLPAALRAQREEPRAIYREALRAVEQDDARDAPAVAALRARWTTRARPNASDRAARLGLALLRDLTYDDSAAANEYRALSDTTHTAPDVYTAYARLAWGRMDYARGARRDALASFESARSLARRVGDRLTETSATTALGVPRANAGSMAAGMATLDTAAALLPASAPDDVVAAVLQARAILLAVQAARGARDTAERAVMLARRAGDRRLEAEGIRALGLVQRIRGFPDSSLALYQSVARLQREVHHRRTLAETLARVAGEYITLRRLGDARATLLEARREGERSRNFFALAGVETGLAAVALRVHDVAEAEARVKRAAELDVAIGDSASLANVESFRVDALFEAGRLDSAWAAEERVLAHWQRAGDISEQILARRTLANVAMARGDLAVASRQLDSADALVRRHRVPELEGALIFDRARLARSAGRDDEAATLYARHLAGLPAGDALARWDAQVRLAELEARRGDPAAATARLAAAGDALDAWRAAQSDSSLRLLAFQATTHEESERGSYFAHAVAALAEHGRREAAFAEAERRRARTLTERVVEAQVLRVADSRASAVRAATPAPPRLEAHDVAAGLPDDGTALLEYVTGSSGAPTTLFVVTRSGLRAARLPAADSLVTAIRYLLAAIEGGDDVAPLARRLGDALLRPALDSLPPSVTRLVVVPDGALHRVPFDVLRLPDGRAALERYEISVAPSAAVAMLLWRRPPRARADARVLAFGDPAIANVAAASADREDGAVFRGAFEEAGALARLPGSAREARLAARFGTNSVALTGAEASATNLVRAPLDSFDVIHLATHALVDERSLMRSAVVLAPGEGRSGFVTPGDLAALHLANDLVVLSACRSAGGVVVDGEGVQGLTAPLLAAGARAVVATAWPIEDRETVALVEDFYRAMADGQPVGAALRSAKLAALRRGAPVRAWASFAVVGDPLVRIPLAPPRPSPWKAAAGVLGGLALIGAFALRRRSRRRWTSDRRE